MSENQIKLVGPEIKGRANETVRLVAEFDHKCYACVHERREKSGYNRICDQQTERLVFDAMVHEDTTDFVISIRDNEKPHLNFDGNVGQIWCPVTIVDEDPQPEPEPTVKDLGAYKYKFCSMGDIHMCKQTPSDPSGDWGDEADFKAAMDICAADKEIKFVASYGDVAESQTNEADKHPECVCDADYKEFTEMYDVEYWQKCGLRFFSCLGNHDYYGIFESRNGDVITGGKNSECIVGYNASVQQRLTLWPTGQQINAIPANGRCRFTFELESGKDKAEGQSDMRFFSYCDYVDLYARKGGYTGKSIWDSNKNGISDEAIRCAKQYVNSNWNTVKDKLVMWDSGSGHGRNGYSKLNYWLKKDDDIYIFLSIDYGDDNWGVTNTWHDRVIHARHIIDINADDPYIKRMVEFVKDTGYSKADEPYNYQYYSPNTLIWLKEILENNTGCKIQINMHHCLPHRTGNDEPLDDNLPKNGGWSYAVISPDGDKDTNEGGKYNKGSNTLTGIEFWFLNKLFSMYSNVIVYTGHLHKTGENKYHVDNKDYPVVMPSTGSPYVYTKDSMTPKAGEGAWIVSLPSLSKPKLISKGNSYRLYKDAEMSIVEVYEKGVVIKCYKIVKDSKNVYDPSKPLFEKVILLKK